MRPQFITLVHRLAGCDHIGIVGISLHTDHQFYTQPHGLVISSMKSTFFFSSSSYEWEEPEVAHTRAQFSLKILRFDCLAYPCYMPEQDDLLWVVFLAKLPSQSQI